MKNLKQTLPHPFITPAFMLGFTISLLSCSTPAPAPQEQTSQIAPQQGEGKNISSLDIQYTIGRGHYRFHSLATDQEATAQTYLDGQVLKSGAVDAQQHSQLLKKAQDFVQSHQNQPPDADALPCRRPFHVIVQVGKKIDDLHGCRANDGALSKLVREGEFLLYSKN